VWQIILMKNDEFLKWFSLVSFCAQNSLSPIVFRFATTENASAERASTSVILFFTEGLKLFLSFCLLVWEQDWNFRVASAEVQEWLVNPKPSLVLSVPAIFFALQNALLQWSASHLSAALFQVTYQGKILVTAGFMVVFMKKPIMRVQWLAIAIMCMGIALVQVSDSKEAKQKSMGNASEQSFVHGFLMLLVACCCSGFASVYTEMVFKQVGAASKEKKASLWLQNMQMATFSMILMCITFFGGMLYSMGSTAVPETDVGSSTLFHGFTGRTCALIVSNAVGGLLVALVIKCADNILRGFSSALATINACILSVFCFGFVIGGHFVVGTAMVIVSTLLYGSILPLPGRWWNSEPQLCGHARNLSGPACPGIPSTEPNGVELSAAEPPGAESEDEEFWNSNKVQQQDFLSTGASSFTPSADQIGFAQESEGEL